MSPYQLDAGTLYAEEIRRFRIDSDKGRCASFARKCRRIGFYNIRNSVTQYTAFLAIGTVLATHSIA